MDSSQATRGATTSRRQVLRWIALTAVGAGVVLTAGWLAKNAAPPARSGASSVQASGYTTPTSANTGAGNVSTTLRVKVMYFQMPQLGAKQEYFALESPAYFRDLLDDVETKHPSLSSMIPTMLVLIDGVKAQPSTLLKEGDEIDFIPTVAGG